MPAPMPAPAAPVPAAIPPYLASRTAARAGRPIEPWKDSLRLQMFIWGGLLLLAFVVPMSIDPMGFQWDLIIDGEGKQKLAPLILASAGLLSLVLAIIPTSPPPRGLMAGLLGLVGFLVPTLLTLSGGDFGLGQILIMLALLGYMLLVPGLLLRSEYRESILPRLFVTIGVLCVLAMYLVPINDDIGLVRVFKALIDAPGKGKILALINLLPIVYAIVSLLAWLPAPSSGAGGVMAWLWITLPAVDKLAGLLLHGEIAAAVKASPNLALLGWVPTAGYLVLLGYGFATVIGKKLE